MSVFGHGTKVIKDITHEDDCLGSLCPDCGCCLHCAEDGHCDGCHDRDCGCAS